MKAAAFPSLSAEAAAPRRSQTSRPASARSRMAKGSASSVRRIISSPIAGVDFNIAFGQIAGPEAGGPFALAPDSDADFAIGRAQFGLQLGLRKRRGQPAAAHQHALHVHVGLRRVERHPRTGAESSRPQFGSDPAMAVFTSGEFAIARAMATAAPLVSAPATSMVTNFLAPSPSRAMARASAAMTSVISSSTMGISRGPGRTPEAPLARSASVSLVEVSPSTESRL